MNDSHHAGRSPSRGLFHRLLRDEGGGEAMEYALIIGLILITAITVVSSLGQKVLAR
jgi:Flp pilus assembly pilin Flp